MIVRVTTMPRAQGPIDAVDVVIEDAHGILKDVVATLRPIRLDITIGQGGPAHAVMHCDLDEINLLALVQPYAKRGR